MNKPAPETNAERQPLNHDRIAQQAMALIDAEGLGGFSFRKLAKRLKCEAMSLYHYFPSKSHLFDALVNICIEETPIPAFEGDIRVWLRTFSLEYRATALRHPGFAQYFLIHRQNHREGLAWLDGCIAVFEQTGLPAEKRAILFRCLGYYMMGAALDESLGYARGPSAAEPVPAEEAARDFPAISAIGPYFSDAHHLPTFEAGLEVLLDWVDREIAALGHQRAGAG